MPGSRHTISHTALAATLLTLQVYVPPVCRAQEDVTEAPELAPPDSAGADAAAAVKAPTSGAATPARHTGPGAAPYVLWCASALSLALGTAFGTMALGAAHDFDDAPSYDQATRVHNLGIAADAGLGLGLLLAITGTVFFFANRGDNASQRDASADSSARGRSSTTVSDLRSAPLVSARARGGSFALHF